MRAPALGGVSVDHATDSSVGGTLGIS